MTREEAWNRIDAIIAKHEIDDVYVTITNYKDYDALRLARKLLEQEHCEDTELINIRQELLDRGDEVVSFRQLVERFEKIEEVYKDIPWTLKQIYANFNILIGEKPCTDAISRQAVLDEMYKRKADGDAITAGFIKALPPVTPAEKQKPCEDAISREAALEIIRDFEYKNSHEEMLINSRINELQPVTPQPKVGHWEWVQYDGNPNIGNWHCSECRAIVNYEPTYRWEKKPYHKFCPNCGAKMQEEKE